MAIEALPTAKNTSDVIDDSWVDSVRAGLALHRDDAPCFLIQFDPSAGTGALTAVNFSGGSGTFNATPDVNVGGWTAGTGGDPGAYAPETGLYLVGIHAAFASNSTGYRQIEVTDNGTTVSYLKFTAGAVNGTGTFIGGYHPRFLTAGDELGAKYFQNSGTTLATPVTLSAVWINSSVS